MKCKKKLYKKYDDDDNYTQTLCQWLKTLIFCKEFHLFTYYIVSLSKVKEM